MACFSLKGMKTMDCSPLCWSGGKNLDDFQCAHRCFAKSTQFFFFSHTPNNNNYYYCWRKVSCAKLIAIFCVVPFVVFASKSITIKDSGILERSRSTSFSVYISLAHKWKPEMISQSKLDPFSCTRGPKKHPTPLLWKVITSDGTIQGQTFLPK